jgi:A/G-specific adenine glycosylase
LLPDPKNFRRLLLAWYKKNQRDLPWRKNTDPYRVLVSELMLQQTQVKTVLPYYSKFLTRFPNARALAAASQESVLASWAGLGYYRRARFLHAAAKAVAKQGFPQSAEGLLDLPGVGAYTAAAVGSISFGLPLAVVDGNVIRVLSRVLALDKDPTTGQGKRELDSAAQALLDPSHPGDFNQALMELGALICAQTKPRCEACPLAAHCLAFRGKTQESYPRLPTPVSTLKIHKSIALITKGANVLAMPRTLSGRAGDEGRMLGYWHFPELELKKGERPEAMAIHLAGENAKLKIRLASFLHSITRYRIKVDAYLFTSEKALKGWRWIGLRELHSKPLASAERRLLKALVAFGSKD